MFRSPASISHDGKVKQIVGGTLGESGLQTNFVSDKAAAYFAELYKRDGLSGGHVIKLGPGNDDEARAALAAFPGGMQIGGGITVINASGWLEVGASHVIVTSWIFQDGKLNWERLAGLVKAIGKSKLVLDLSCRKRGDDYFVVTDRWQKFTDMVISPEILQEVERELRRVSGGTPSMWRACAWASTRGWWRNWGNGRRSRSPMRAVRRRSTT